MERSGTEQRGQQPGREDVETPEQEADAKAKEVRAQLDRYLRTGVLAPVETRALTVSGQGVVGDRPYYNQLAIALRAFDGVRLAGATVISSSTGNPITVGYLDDTSNTGQQVGENTTDNTSADPSGTPITLGAYKFDSKWIKLSTELITDAQFPVEQTVLNFAAERIGRITSTKFASGNGSGTPQGYLSAATVGKVAASQSALNYEELLDLVHAVDPAVRNSGRCKFILNDTTLAAIRKLKSEAGYIFTPGSAGQPDQILGYGYVCSPDVPALSAGAGSKVVAFGDFSKYFIRDVTAVETVVARELFVGDGLVGYRLFSRHDGRLTDVNAVKTLRLAT